MKKVKLIEKLKDLIEKNPIYIYLLFLTSIQKIFQLFISAFKMIKSTPIANDSLLKLISNFNWSDFVLQFVIITALYMLLKRYVKMKEALFIMVGEINEGFKDVTNNINDLERVTNNKIRFIDLKATYPNIENDEFIKKLHSSGLSKEDLIEIGVNDDFMKQNENKLLPRSVIQKYSEFKYELNKHNSKNTNDSI